MNKYNKQYLTFLLASAALLQVRANSTITITGLDIDASKTQLAFPQATLTGTGENTICFDLNSCYTGFCQLTLGSMKKTIYIDDGTSLQIAFNSEKQGKDRFVFNGKSASANTYLNNLDNMSKNVDQLANLPETFRHWETLRQKYGQLRATYAKTGWEKASKDELCAQLKEYPQLWFTTEYKAFFLDALYAIGMKTGGSNIHDYTLEEMKYVQQNVCDRYMADELMKHIMTMYMKLRGADDSADLMQLFLTVVTDTKTRDEILTLHAAWKKVERGQQLPDFSFTDINGKQVNLSDFKGRYVFIDCWATWCGPCKGQLPHLKNLEERYHDKNIVFVSISSDKDRSAWTKMVREKSLGGVQLNEPRLDSDFFTLFQVNAIPRFILLNPDGTVYDANMSRPSNSETPLLLDMLLK